MRADNLATVPSARPWTGPPAQPLEMESAGRVQAHLLPRDLPQIETLELGGECLPGRAVGGDFYDFLAIGEGRVVLVLGDVSGHGVPAALMMATLQSTLRAHYVLSRTGLRQRIESVNRLFFECTAAEHYAALFVGEYDDRTRRLRYANCGHVAPQVVRRDGTVERLEPGGTVVGLFESWNGSVGEISLDTGETLVAVTDGIVEAADPGEGEFGELRLRSSMLRNRHLGPAALIRAIARDMRLVCGRRPVDDATIMVARARARQRGLGGEK